MPDRSPHPPASGIRDNHTRGSVGDFLREKITAGATLSVVSAYFTIYAFEALKERLRTIERLDFLFGEPRFIRSVDPEGTPARAYRIEDEGLRLSNRLQQKRVARDCADWIRAKVHIRSVRRSGFLHGKLYHIARDGVEEAILGSSNFTVRGLGLGASPNIELNLEVDSNRDRRDLKAWFDALWDDANLVEDVRDEVLRYLEQLYANHAPAFIYYKTLFHLFEKYLADQDREGLLDEPGQAYYRDTLDEIGAFPERKKPVSLFPEIDTRGMFLSYDRLNDEISNYRLSLFNPSGYVRPEHKARYEGRIRNFTQEDREHYLIGMMRVNFLKRLESSVHSFEISMGRTIEKIERLEDRIRRFKRLEQENPDLDMDDLNPEDADDEDLQNALQVGEKLRFDLAHLDVDAWLKDLAQDKQQLRLLYLSARDVDVERDAKLRKLKALIAGKVRNPTRNRTGTANRKVLVFTAFADTTAYLYEALADWTAQELGIRAALVSGGSGGNKTSFGGHDFNHILTHFSPVSKQRAKMNTMPQDAEIDLLIATDCISEGQNLQDCDYLINYDIHWNPVRLIQRFGRIDRIGSLGASIQMVNFWPTDDLNRLVTWLVIADKSEPQRAQRSRKGRKD